MNLSPEDSVVLNSLGQAKARLDDYRDTDSLFRTALEKKATGDTIRHRMINLSSIADNLMRWAEKAQMWTGFVIWAEKKLLEAFDICQTLIRLDKTDVKSQDLLRHIETKLGYFYKRLKDEDKAFGFFQASYR